MTFMIPPAIILDIQHTETVSQVHLQKASLSVEEEDRLFEEEEARINAEWKALYQEEAQERMYADHRAFYGGILEGDETGRMLQEREELRRDYETTIKLM